jgi:hypothetical protein
MTTAEQQNREGLMYLTWDQFDSPDSPGSGYKFMEREPVLILDQIVNKIKRNLDITLGYTSKSYSDKISLHSRDSHRVGKAIRVRVLNSKKRFDFVKHLILFDIKRIAVSKDTVYFDTDNLKEPHFYLW